VAFADHDTDQTKYTFRSLSLSGNLLYLQARYLYDCNLPE